MLNFIQSVSVLKSIYSIGIVLYLSICLTNGQHNGFVVVADSRVYYEENGVGEPIFLLHAGLLDHAMWKEQVSELAKHYRVITCDLRGHGLTQNGKINVASSEFIKVIMDSLKIQKANFVGLSLGTLVLIDVALRYPERINKIVLASPGLNGWDQPTADLTFNQQFWDDYNQVKAQADTLKYVENFVRVWTDGHHRAPNQVNNLLRDEIKRKVLENRKANWFVYWPEFLESNAAKHLGEIKSKTLILVGSLDVKDILQISDFLASHIPHARKIIFQGAAHMINLEKPLEFNKVVLNFIK